MRFSAPARDTALLLARLGLGVVFFAHGWQKLFTNGVDGTSAFFGQVGVPMPTLSAWFAAVVELLGGAALVLGIAVPVAAVLLVVDMLGAYLFVHAGNGLFIQENGYELVLGLGAASLMLAVLGAGRFSVDHAVLARVRGRSRQPA